MAGGHEEKSLKFFSFIRSGSQIVFYQQTKFYIIIGAITGAQIKDNYNILLLIEQQNPFMTKRNSKFIAIKFFNFFS